MKIHFDFFPPSPSRSATTFAPLQAKADRKSEIFDSPLSRCMCHDNGIKLRKIVTPIGVHWNSASVACSISLVMRLEHERQVPCIKRWPRKNGFSVAVISREMSAWKLPSQPHLNELAKRPRNESKLTDAICENRIQIEAFWFHYIGHEKPVGSLIDLLSISITNNAADLGIFGCAHVRRRWFSPLLSFCVNQTEKFRFLKCLWMEIAARHNSNASSAIDKLLFSSVM